MGDVGSACACAEFGSLVFSSGLAAFTTVLGVSSTGAFMLVVTAASDWTIFDFAAESRAVSIRRKAFAGFSSGVAVAVLASTLVSDALCLAAEPGAGTLAADDSFFAISIF